jgi:SanA protein
MALVAAAGLWVFAALQIGPSVAPYVTSDLAALPDTRVALVLGCSPWVESGRKNLFFTTRIDAAAQLYRSGKVSHIIVSGDNGTPDYDEPSAMKSELVLRGVPERKITRDFAGFRTLDSVLRADQVFGVKELIVVSQRFHVERAVYLARAHGLTAFGFAAPDVGGHGGRLVRLREMFSRLIATLDVHVFDTTPRFGGPPQDLESSS